MVLACRVPAYAGDGADCRHDRADGTYAGPLYVLLLLALGVSLLAVLASVLRVLLGAG